MASTMSTATIAAKANMLAPLNGMKSSAFSTTSRRVSVPSKAGKIKCMQVWPPVGLKKFETLSYLPPLSDEALLAEVQYLLDKGWVPCLEFEPTEGFVYRKYNSSPGYYDGRYWTMWKLPMFGCTDPAQVLNEVAEAKKAYPDAFIRVIGFDNVRQVQCISFIVYTPPRFTGN